MHTARILTIAMAAMLITGGALFAAEPAADLPAAFVRVQQAPAIDGDGRDWAGIKAEQEITLPGRAEPVARFKVAWDEQAFYVLLTVKDDSPMKNGSTVFQELLKGGDAIGICFGGTDGTPASQRIMLALVNGKPEVLAMRPQWPDKAHPYTYFTQAAGKVPMDFVWRLPEAKLAVKTFRGGYTAEVAIPANVLGFQPTAGLLLSFDVQVIFSDAAGSLNAATAWWHSTGNGPMCTVDIATEARLYPEAWGRARLYVADPGPRVRVGSAAGKTEAGVPISFSLPRDARVTLNVMDDTGWVVRELLRVEPLKKGEHTVYWDGRDRWGSPMPAGKYRWRMAYLDGIKAAFAASVGNSGRPPYRTPDGLGSIGGAHGGPMAVAADTEGVYMLNGGEEGQKVLRKIDPATGKALWFASCGTFGNGQAMAADGKFAYMVYSGPYSDGTRLARLDAKTGRNAPIGPKNDPVVIGDKPVAGLAIANGKAYFSVTADNRIGVVDLATGDLGKDIPLPAPAGLCKLDDAALLVCSQTQVLKLSLETGQVAPLITGLAAPRAVALDAGGTIYVSDLGASQQIKTFAAAGKLLATIGKPGGRALNVPKYDPLEFRNVTGLAIGPDGNLWLVEYFQPRRYAKLTRDGKWLEDFYGPNNGGFIVDLDDPRTLYFGSLVREDIYHSYQEQGSLKWVQTTIDYDAYTKAPDPSKGFTVKAIHTLSPNGIDYSATPDYFSGQAVWGETLRSYIFTATNGKRYLWRTPGLWVWSDARWKPAAIVGTKDAPFWSDANGDGLAQPEEVSKDAVPVNNIHYIDRNLILYGMGGTLKPARVDARGVPFYAGGTFTPFFKDEQPPLLHRVFDNCAFAPANGMVPGKPDNTDALYYTTELEPANGQGFWDRYCEGRIVKVKDGKVQWIVGHHSEHGDNGHDGDTMRLTAMTGEVDGVVLFADVNGQFIAYTTDGLCLGWTLNDGNGHAAGADAGGSASNAIYIENMATGEFLKDPKTGKRLLVSWTTEDIRVLEVSGAFGKDITRVDGGVMLPTALPRSASLPGQCSIPASSWVKLNRFNPYPDGYDAEWAPGLPSISFRAGKVLVADLRLRRDAGSLCVFADVLDQPAFPPTEGTQPANLFGQAQGLELLIGPPAPDRTAPAPGDTRVFLTATRDASGWLKGHAFACRPASPPLAPTPELRLPTVAGGYDGNPPAAPIDFSKGLAEIPGTRIKVKERQDRRGYRIEAEIPLALLPEITRVVPVTFSREKAISEMRSDLAGPVRFSAAVHLAGGKGVSRVAWMDDGEQAAGPTSMNPSKWGWANVQVELQWDDLAGSPAFNIYRGATANPADAKLVQRGIAGTSFIDNPGLGVFHYWLVPVEGGLEGQWLGPMQARDGRADFGAFTALPPLALADVKEVFVYPGTTVALSLQADGELKAEAPGITVASKGRTAFISVPGGAGAGTKLPATISSTAGRASFDVVTSPVPVNAYRAAADVVMSVAAGEVKIDSTKPADGDAGQPCVTQVLAGRGDLSLRQFGRHGFVIPRWKGEPGNKRKVCAPFEDTFATDTFQYHPRYANCTFTVDTESSAGPEGQGITGLNGHAVGESQGITIKATDNAEHVVTIFSGTAFGWTAAVRYSVEDPVTGKNWQIADLDGKHGQTLTQIRFTGSVRFIITQLKRGNAGNFAAIFLD